MKRVFMVLFFGINLLAYSQVKEFGANYFKDVEIRLGAGVLIPQNGLKHYFGVSPLFELGAMFPLKRNRSFELIVQVSIPNQEKEFTYLRVNDTINSKASDMYNGILKFKKEIIKSINSPVFVGVGVGVSNIVTNGRNPYYVGGEEKKYETITSVLISPEIGVNYSFGKECKLYFSLGFQYSPYKMEGALREGIGTLFYIPKVSCTF